MFYIVALLGLGGLFVAMFALWFVVWAFTMSGPGYGLDLEDAYVQISD